MKDETVIGIMSAIILNGFPGRDQFYQNMAIGYAASMMLKIRETMERSALTSQKDQEET